MKKIILILTLFISLGSFATKSSIQPKLDSVKAEQPQNENLIDKDSESYYKMLYENSKESNTELLSLLTTAMTVVIAVIIAIIGSSFFYNYRFNKKEYELLTKEITNKIEEAQKELLKDSRIEIEKISEINKKEIQQKFVQISETYKTNYDSLNDSLKSIIEAYKNNVEDSISNQNESLKNIKNQISKLEENSKLEVNVKSKALNIDILGLKADLYFLKNWYSLALSYYVQQCHLCIETNQTWQLKFVTKDIINSIQESILSKKTITSATKLNIEKLISVLPDTVLDKKKKIEEEYVKIEVKEVELNENTI